MALKLRKYMLCDLGEQEFYRYCVLIGRGESGVAEDVRAWCESHLETGAWTRVGHDAFHIKGDEEIFHFRLRWA